ncbi:MAG TPA: M23 family metallopeptidase [Dyella sp.]|uniref:M23 family metallopeptidase n=1 Tax=Dyella sp. TaxID=1869338 RepID=UPI002BC48485|nr:M23 family metallopeptidase [Dyella sp.]HUB89003.1 M23 family metallopeptidase [Dyella sp.]
MFAAACHRIAFTAIQLRGKALLAGMLGTWLALQVLHAWQADAQPGTPIAATPASFALPDKLHARLADTSPYWHTLSRLYENADVSTSSDPIPSDEAATFHPFEVGMPLALARITSDFGQRPNPFGSGHVFHRGIDLAAPTGTLVQAVAEGTVITAKRDRSYGEFVVIDHHNGYRSLYAHNSQLLVKAGDRVKVGQLIAKVGSTGQSTGPHLHFEIHRDGERVDPFPYLAAL